MRPDAGLLGRRADQLLEHGEVARQHRPRQLGELAGIPLHALDLLRDPLQQLLEIEAERARATPAASPKVSRRLS